jgi:hypothetical protein
MLKNARLHLLSVRLGMSVKACCTFRYTCRVPFDRELLEAKLALDLIASADMPGMAWDAIEAGVDGPATKRLAAMESPTY